MSIVADRELTPIEEEVLRWIEVHPLRTPYDVTVELGDSEVVIYAVQHLIWRLYVDQNLTTHAMVARIRQVDNDKF